MPLFAYKSSTVKIFRSDALSLAIFVTARIIKRISVTCNCTKVEGDLPKIMVHLR